MSLGAPKIGDCEQTAEGIAKQMFENESFEIWCVIPATVHARFALAIRLSDSS